VGTAKHWAAWNPEQHKTERIQTEKERDGKIAKRNELSANSRTGNLGIRRKCVSRCVSALASRVSGIRIRSRSAVPVCVVRARNQKPENAVPNGRLIRRRRAYSVFILSPENVWLLWRTEQQDYARQDAVLVLLRAYYGFV